MYVCICMYTYIYIYIYIYTGAHDPRHSFRRATCADNLEALPIN